MNLFDIIVLAIIISSTLMGLYKGLMRLSIGLICFCLTIVSAYFMFPLVETVLSEHVQNSIAVNIISGIVGYLLSMLFFAFISNQAGKAVKEISGGLVDRFLGLGLGALRGVLISTILFGMIAIFASDAYVGFITAKDLADKIDRDKYPKWLSSAVTYNFIESSAQTFSHLMPNQKLNEINLPQTSKHLPEISNEMIDKAAGAAAQAVIKQAIEQSEHKNHEESNLKPNKSLDDKDNLDSHLKEILGQ